MQLTTAGAGFLGNYAAGFKPTFLIQSNKIDANSIGDIATPGTVTGAPSGINEVIVTGPNADGQGGNTLRVNQFTVQGQINNTNTPAVVPNAPISLIATAGNASVLAKWTVPGNGGSALTVYHVRVVDAATGLKVFSLRDIPAPAGSDVVSLNITGLPNGIAFRTQVQAINAQGIGPVSNHSNAVTPMTLPSQPTIRIATAGVGTATGNWASASNGGSAIRVYHVRAVDAATGTKVFVLRDVAGSARSPDGWAAPRNRGQVPGPGHQRRGDQPHLGSLQRRGRAVTPPSAQHIGGIRTATSPAAR